MLSRSLRKTRQALEPVLCSFATNSTSLYAHASLFHAHASPHTHPWAGKGKQDHYSTASKERPAVRGRPGARGGFSSRRRTSVNRRPISRGRAITSSDGDSYNPTQTDAMSASFGHSNERGFGSTEPVFNRRPGRGISNDTHRDPYNHGQRAETSAPSGSYWRSNERRFTSRRSSSFSGSRGYNRIQRADTSEPSHSYGRSNGLSEDESHVGPTARPQVTIRAPKQFRSKHFDPAVEKKGDLPKLEPHILSGRLKKLCEENKINAAIAMLKNAPLDAQNAVVWNTLIWECMKARLYSQAYALYTDMKRRGFSPTTRTYQTMFSGLTRIEDWASFPRQMKNAEALYQGYLKHMESLHRHDPKSTDISSAPLSMYLKLLGDAGRYQDIFDVYYNLDPSGPIQPDHLVFTAMFQALSPLKIPYGVDAEAASLQNASSAKLLWTQMLRATKKRQITIDSHLVASAITAMSKGRANDQEFAFTIVRDYLGVALESTDQKRISLIPLSSPTLAAVLLLCKNSGKHSLCIDIFKQVRQRHDAADIIDRAHIEEVLKSQAAIESPPQSAEFEVGLLDWMIVSQAIRNAGKENKDTLRPHMSTLLGVLNVCWRSKDWNSAAKAFHLMTGFRPHDFMDGVEQTPKEPQLNRRVPPTSECTSLLLRTALATENRAHMRQALRLVHHLDLTMLASNARVAPGYDAPKSKKALKAQLFHSEKLATAVLDTLDHIFRNSGDRDIPHGEDLVRWKELKTDAQRLIGISHTSGLIPIKQAS